MSYRKYSADPHEMSAKHPGKCSSCGASYAKGERIFYYPRGDFRYPYPCGCGDRNQNDFMHHAMAEDF